MYSFTSRVRFSEVGAEEKMTLHALVSYFQDCSFFHGADVHMGVNELKESGRLWLLASWQIIIRRRPKLGESIRINTWAYGFRGFYGYRNFTLEDAGGNICAYANAIFSYLDAAGMHPTRIPEEMADVYGISPQYPMENAPRKIALPKESAAADSLTVTASQTDYYQHMNNTIYIQLAQDYLPDSFEIAQVRAEYRRAAVRGDRLFPHLSREENRFYVAFRDEKGGLYAAVEFTGPSD